jgi:hypothetical protein
MAVLPTHPGLTVQVVVDGQPLLEHNDEDGPSELDTITKYVEAQPGSEFVIKYTFDKTFLTEKDVGIDAFIDGTILAQSIVRKDKLCSPIPWTINGFRTRANGKWMLRKWTFQTLPICANRISSGSEDVLTNVVEHDQSMESAKTVESIRSIGCIKVEFQFGEAGESIPMNKIYGLPRSTEIAESMLKGDAKSLQVG